MSKEEKHSLEKPEKYKIVVSKDALWDIKSTKKYILDTFKYREYAEKFSNKIKKAIEELESFPKGYEATGYVIEGLSIYFKPYSTYLIFFVVEDSTITVIRVLKDRMYWQAIIKKMQKISR
ncbi:MAG: type II toxin-antitoxin system RelE/ParE family toxin [Roseburia sp.]|nr:type II toxin-antitoxin system RelE/ParE family toxin [Roseburia sp.]